jgi:hypothetical protein
MVTFRDAHIRSHGYTVRGKEIKNASQDDIDKLEARMGKGLSTKATSSRSRHDLGKALTAAAAASSEAGLGGFDREIFGGVGLSAQCVPDVKEGSFQVHRHRSSQRPRGPLTPPPYEIHFCIPSARLLLVFGHTWASVKLVRVRVLLGGLDLELSS